MNLRADSLALRLQPYGSFNDFGVRDDELAPSGKKRLLVYRQIYKNENFYHFYEENKPAWA
jgi:hypothetical protein